MHKYLLIPAILFIFSCNNSKQIQTDTNHAAISYYGRTMPAANNEVALVGAASYAEFAFTGDSCVIYLRNNTHPGDYNYVVIELDNQYKSKLKVDGTTAKPFTIRAGHSNAHLLRIFKATESHNGQVMVAGVKGTGIKKTTLPARKKIEFIGNSITAGMANDIKEIPCGTGKWYDQHNAYLAYGPRVARALNTDFMLSAVSGIGIYRNWNSDGPTMPQVYESAFLEIDSVQRWDFKRYTPDIVSICLGTNDFSDGDGKNPRLPFDSATYIRNYIGFIGTVYKHYPSAQIVLLTSPMLSGAKSEMMFNCLQTVKARSTDLYTGKPPIGIFRFQPMIPKGCGYHPDIDDHAVLAKELEPFFRKLLTGN